MRKLRNSLAFCIAVMLIMGTLLTGCGNKGKQQVTETAATQGSTAAQKDSSAETAAAEESTTAAAGKSDKVLTVMSNRLSGADNAEIIKKVAAAYDGTINWIDGNTEKFNLLFATGEYGDVGIGNLLQDIDVSKYAATGLLIPLDDYINEELTPNLCKLFEEHPTAKSVATWTDGHIYTLPRYNGISADYLESVIFINKTWLDKLDLEIPTTTEELYEVLKAFKNGDPNGNGQADEIPMTAMNNFGSSFLEEMLGSWGAPTKHGAYDSFVTVKNGQVKFAPVMDEWKEMMKWYHRLYSEGLLDQEVFTMSYDSLSAKFASGNVGVAWNKTNPFTNSEDYIAIEPIHAPGYEVSWRVHPGALGVKNLFFITDHCEDIEGAMRWVDSMYTEEATLENWYGPVGETFTVKDGMYYVNEEEKKGWTYKHAVTNLANWPGVFNKEEVGTLLEPLDFLTAQMKNYEMYEPYITDEVWPRPYYDEENASRVAELRTDIFNVVEQKKAAWITGESDIDAEWEQYKEDLYGMGLQELLDINQKAYDVFNASMSN